MTNKCSKPQQLLEAISEAYNFLESFLNENDFLAGNEVSLADICCFATVTSMLFQELDPIKHERTIEWIHRMKGIPFCEVNQKGAEELVTFLKKYL